MWADYWAHKFIDDPKAKDEVVDDDFDIDNVLAEFAAEAEGVDDIDDWETLT